MTKEDVSSTIFGIVIQMEGLQLKPTMESCRMWVRFPPVPIFATLAQQEEHEICNFVVVGSIPTGSYKYLIRPL